MEPTVTLDHLVSLTKWGLGCLGAVLVSILVATWRASRWCSDVENGISDLRKEMAGMRSDCDHNFRAIVDRFDSLTKVLRVKKVITQAEYNILNERVALRAHTMGNPISQDEANRLNLYLQKGKQHQTFTPDEAQDFRLLSERYANDPQVRKEEPAEQLTNLLVLAGVVFAMFYLLQKDE